MNIVISEHEVIIEGIKINGENQICIVDVDGLELDLVRNRNIPVVQSKFGEPSLLGWDANSYQKRLDLLAHHVEFCKLPNNEEELNKTLQGIIQSVYEVEKDTATDKDLAKCRRYLTKNVSKFDKVIEERHVEALWEQVKGEVQYDVAIDIAKEVVKGAGKHAARFLPGVGTLLCFKDAKEYWDYKCHTQAALSFIQGVSINVPGAGHIVGAVAGGLNYGLDGVAVLKEDVKDLMVLRRREKEFRKEAENNHELMPMNKDNKKQPAITEKTVNKNILKTLENEEMTQDIKKLLSQDEVKEGSKISSGKGIAKFKNLKADLIALKTRDKYNEANCIEMDDLSTKLSFK